MLLHCAAQRTVAKPALHRNSKLKRLGNHCAMANNFSLVLMSALRINLFRDSSPGCILVSRYAVFLCLDFGNVARAGLCRESHTHGRIAQLVEIYTVNSDWYVLYVRISGQASARLRGYRLWDDEIAVLQQVAELHQEHGARAKHTHTSPHTSA